MLNQANFTIFLWLLPGIGLALFNLSTQYWMVYRLNPNSATQSVGWLMGSSFLRLLVAGVVFLAVLKYGFAPLILTFCGWWLTRTASLFWLNNSVTSFQ